MRETERGQSEQVSKRGMDRRMDGKERERKNREMLWSGTQCLAGIRSGPHEASLAHTLNRNSPIQQQRATGLYHITWCCREPFKVTV